MKNISTVEDVFSKESLDIVHAQHLSHIISFGPVIFESARVMLQWGIFELLNASDEGLTEKEIIEKTQKSKYAVRCLLESSLTMGTILLDKASGKYRISLVGWFLLNDPAVRVDIDFNHFINYKGFYFLDDALEEGRPAGLKTFGDYKTLYEGLSSLPKECIQSWLAFDHYYSNTSFKEALDIIFKREVKHIIDIGGNTGRFAQRCTEYDADVNVTICDLPQQIAMMQDALRDFEHKDRIEGYAINILDEQQCLPTAIRYDAIWMSQFLDCFSEDEIVSILQRVHDLMDTANRLYIMEPLWDRQKYPPAAFALTQISLYFAVMANGNSKMYGSEAFFELIRQSGFVIEEVRDYLGMGAHSLIICKKI